MRRLCAKVTKLESKQKKQENTSILDIERTKGGKGKQLTLSGSLSLAIRRNLSNIATSDLGAVLLQDISRYSVCRAETKAGTALIASSRIWFRAMYDELIRPSSSSEPLKLILHSFKEDATNTGILKGSKMGALILRSAYLKASHVPSCDDELPDIDWENFDISEWLDTIVRVADVLPVVAGTSEATYAQMLKQLESLGCITWKQIQADDALRQQHACVSRSFDSVGTV